MNFEHPATNSESSESSAEVLFTPEQAENPQVEKQLVTVRRNMYDAEGMRIAGKYELEPGWSVEKVDKDTGAVIVTSPDGSMEKRYSIELLQEIQAESLRQTQHELGEEALEDVGVAVEAAGRLLSFDDQAERKKDAYDYLRTALPPVIRPQSEGQTNDEYDFLFSSDDNKVAREQQKRSGVRTSHTLEEKQRKYYDTYVTSENREASVQTLVEALKATPELREVLVLSDLQPASMEAVDAIRENAEVRFQVAKVLAEKLERLVADPHNDMGWRINKNDPNNLKNDQVFDRKMSSRLYAVNMALKMIDGEFSSRQEGNDPIERDESGSVAIGQHRHAASTILMSYE